MTSILAYSTSTRSAARRAERAANAAAMRLAARAKLAAELAAELAAVGGVSFWTKICDDMGKHRPILGADALAFHLLDPTSDVEYGPLDAQDRPIRDTSLGF